MEPATDTKLLYHTLDLHALVRKYARHLQDASMLAELNKKKSYYLEGQVLYWCLVNIVNKPLQTCQRSKVRHQRSADPQQQKLRLY